MSTPEQPSDMQAIRNDKPIALRLPDEARHKTFLYAEGEGRSASNFARRLYLRALTDYERDLDTSARPA